ncbi:MAG TPA: alpha/beta fold hydrolase [Lysobacter sp.]
MPSSTVLFVQGAGPGAHAADQALASSLQTHLGSGYNVRYPQMPGEDDPDPAQWKARVAQELSDVQGPLVLVAHSAGGPILLKYLADEQAPAISGLVLIAPPFLGSGGWDWGGWSIDTLLASNRFTSQVTGSTPVFIHHSRDDQVVPFAHLQLYRARLPHAVIRVFDDRGHQFGNDLSEVARDISSL